MCAECSGDVAAHGIGGEEKYVSVAACCEDHSIGRVGGNLTRDHVTNYDAFGMTVDFDHVHHFGAGIHCNTTFGDLFFKSLVTADQELLTGLTTSVKCAGNLSTTK